MLDTFSKDNLIPARHAVIADQKQVLIDGYILPNYDSFALRMYESIWVLSAKGRMITYGSYQHIIEAIQVIMENLSCWRSETSLVYFLQTTEYQHVIDKILSLREIDHGKESAR